MSFLRRWLGGTDGGADAPAHPTDEEADPEADAEERRRDLDVLREEQARFGDLALRQQRYARYAWAPPAQGGERRADDGVEDAKRG